MEYLYYDKILELPKSKLIHIIRDPRDVILSFKNQPWLPNNIDNCIDIYCKLMNDWIKLKSKIPQNNFLELNQNH